MEDSVLRLAIFSAIAIAIIYIIFGYFAPATNNETQFKTSLDYAEGTIGKSHAYNIRLTKDSGFGASRLDTRTRNVRFECSSTDTCHSGKLEIGPRILKVNDDIPVQAHFRCVNKEILNDCVIYFGKKPAQLEISNWKMADKISRGTNVPVLFTVSNTGSLDSVDAKYELKIFEIKKVDGVEKKLVKQDISGQIDKLSEGQKKDITQQFSVSTPGKFAAEISVQGEDSGFDSSQKEFEAIDSVSASCSAGEKVISAMQGDVCRTQYSCIGCDTGAECKIRWIAKGILENQITDIYPTGIYVQTPSLGQDCQ